jgi:hypothetical protein
MKFLLILSVMPWFLRAQADPAFEVYKAWDLEHRGSDSKAGAQSLFEVSTHWVARWPDSRVAWGQRRTALLDTQNRSPQLWKQVGENLIRLNPPHTFASTAAYDWVTAHVNLKEAEQLIASEIEWQQSRPTPASLPRPSLADRIDEAHFSTRLFGPWCTLARAQIQMKEFAAARDTIARIHNWLDGDFKRYFDQDPLATFPDYESKYFILSAELAQAEGRKPDALAFFQQVICNPYFRRVYGG